MAESPEFRPGHRARVIDELCDRFEDGWRCGHPERIEDVVLSAPEEIRPGLFRAAIEIECEYRRRAGESVGGDEVRVRFAALGPWASAILNDVFPAEPMLILDVIHGPYTGQSFPLVGHSIVTIGRLPTHQIQLPDDPKLSRAHCLIEVNPPLARLVDLGSKWGTAVNGENVSQAELRDGDEVQAGLTMFRVRVPSVEGAPLTLPATPGTGSYFGLPPVVPGYRIGRELGRGGMGVVYLATPEAGGEEVAVKTLLPALPPTRVAWARFLRESEVLRQLSHSKIVGFREAGVSGPMLYFVMEYVPGINADTIVKMEGPLLPARVLDWANQFIDALAHAHEKKFIHRDVKPSNLLVVGSPGNEQVKVSDFGLARAYEESSMSGITVANTPGGTPGYMAPEQVTNFRNVLPTADQYAVGATLFKLLTGRSVYEHAASPEMLRRILDEDPIPLRSDSPPLPDPFGPVIRRSLARNPANRFPDLRALLVALNSV